MKTLIICGFKVQPLPSLTEVIISIEKHGKLYSSSLQHAVESESLEGDNWYDVTPVPEIVLEKAQAMQDVLDCGVGSEVSSELAK